jgi:hypothetical protein
MQAGRHGDLSASNLEFQIKPDISRTPTYTARSNMADKKARGTSLFWEAAATMIAGACANCFAPHRSKIREGHVKPSEDAHDVSTSSSKFSFLPLFIYHVHVILQHQIVIASEKKACMFNLTLGQIRCGRPSKFDPCKNAKL